LGGINPAPGSQLNLNDQDLIVNYEPGHSSLADVAADIATGYAGGAWNGPGIMSDVAATNGSTALGYAEATDVFGSFPATFSGRTVDGSAVLIRYTYYGDANLDGLVNVRDLMNLASHWQQTGQFWFAGDFDYDGVVGPKDLGLLALNWQDGGSPAPSLEDALSSFGLTNAVPEPAVGVICGLILPATLCGRRVRRSG
jgi:hypothetical protein